MKKEYLKNLEKLYFVKKLLRDTEELNRAAIEALRTNNCYEFYMPPGVKEVLKRENKFASRKVESIICNLKEALEILTENE